MGGEKGLVELEPEAVKAMVDAGDAVLVDIREPHEWAEERIPGAVHMPMSALDLGTWPKPEGKTVVIYCAGGVRSAMVGDHLLSSGHASATHMIGGIGLWRALGLPTER